MSATVTPSERQERTIDSIDAELADLLHQAGRMTVNDSRYADLHERISDLITERLAAYKTPSAEVTD